MDESKRKAATLGRTTDLRIIAETAIPRSTTELQQLSLEFPRRAIVYNLPLSQAVEPTTVFLACLS